MRKWRIEDSAELYNIPGWGLKYFSINDKGHVQVTPKEGGPAIDLKEVIDTLQLRDVQAPVLLRFPDILDDRIRKISECFHRAAQEYEYKSKNYIVYPIKVNQMQPVVSEIVSHGNKYNIGLEAGSKPELHAVLAVNTHEDSIIICNGYKDEDYIELALLAQKMGRRVFIVVEKMNELKLVAGVSKRLNVVPQIGIRIKLSSSGSGKWEESGGDVSKFGLNSSELLEALEFLEKNRMMDCLKLIHFHIGSQITKIRRIKNALREAMQFFVQLQKLGFNIEFVDIGGGLGVDYDGTRSSSGENSMNYSIQEYVNDSVSALVDVCTKNNLPHPNIITESGRSLTAHHSVLIIQALETTQLPQWDDDEPLDEDAHELAKELYNIWDKIDPARMFEDWHDALQIREEALELFSLGLLSLRAPRAHRETVLVRGTRRTRPGTQHEAPTGGTPQGRTDAARKVLLQLLPVPVAPGLLGHRPDVPDNAYCPPGREAHPSVHHPGHDMRLRRQDQPLCRPAGQQLLPERARTETQRTVLPRRFPCRSLSGDTGRPPQPVRRHKRRSHLPDQGRIRDRPGDRRRGRCRRVGLCGIQSQETGPKP